MTSRLPVELSPETTRAAAFRFVRRALAEAGFAEAALDARVLVLDALGISPLDLATSGERPIGPEGARRLARFLARRLAREPVHRILGTREFWGLPFRLSPDTLVPRPDTETLVEAALAASPDREGASRMLDLGTGSGCILVALLHERPGAWGLGLDRSPAALATARANARLNGVGERAAFVAADWGAPLAGCFDLVVSNPPYIAAHEIPTLAPEVRDHDPPAALDGGPDGLDAYRAIFNQTPVLLSPGGVLALEIGWDQADSVAALGIAAGLPAPALRRDLAGQARVLVFGRPGGTAQPSDTSS